MYISNELSECKTTTPNKTALLSATEILETFIVCHTVRTHISSLQCFDIVGLAAGRAYGLQKIEW